MGSVVKDSGSITSGDLFDLPRNAQGVALIGDPRNDENLIVSQLHPAFLRFHNAVVDDVGKIGAGDDGFGQNESVFEKASRLVRWHYQWIILHHFLPETIGKDLVAGILQNGRKLYGMRLICDYSFQIRALFCSSLVISLFPTVLNNSLL